MIRLFKILLLIAIVAGAVFVGQWFTQNQGSVEILWLGQKISLTVSKALIGLVVLFFGLYLITSALGYIFSTPKRVKKYKEKKDLEKVIQEATKGITAITQNDTEGAKKASKNIKKISERRGKDYILPDIIEAHANNISGEKRLNKENFVRLEANKSTKTLGLQGLMVTAKNEGNIAGAIEHAEALYKQTKDQTTLVFLVELYKENGDWNKALKLLDKNRPLDNILNTESSAILVANAVDKDETSYARRAFDVEASFQPAAAVYIDRLIDANKYTKAVEIISNVWKENPSSWATNEFLRAIAKQDKEKQYQAAKKLAANNPSSLLSEYVLGRTAFDAKNYDEAKVHAKTIYEAKDGSLNRNLAITLMLDLAINQGNIDVIQRLRDELKYSNSVASWVVDGKSYENVYEIELKDLSKSTWVENFIKTNKSDAIQLAA